MKLTEKQSERFVKRYITRYTPNPKEIPELPAEKEADEIVARKKFIATLLGEKAKKKYK